jgi:hypothetical protein
MTIRNDHGDELTYHGGPLDGESLNVLSPPGPHDDGYEVRTTDDGMILGAWWIDSGVIVTTGPNLVSCDLCDDTHMIDDPRYPNSTAWVVCPCCGDGQDIGSRE